MIDERHEELAALYALDLLEGEERTQFEATLRATPELQTLVRELRTASMALARSATAEPPARLRDRVFSSIQHKDQVAPAAAAPDNVIRPAIFSRRALLPWAIAASFAVVAAWTALRFISTDAEAAHLRRQQAIADVALQSIRQQLEAERIVTRRQVEDLAAQVKTASSQLAEARSKLENANAQLAAANAQSADRATRLTSAEQELAAARAQIADRERQVAGLTQQIDALTGASAEIDRQLNQAQARIARMSEEMQFQRDLADFKITMLASLAKDNPKALAVAVWDPKRREGVLKVENLPALQASQDYQLWVIDPQYKDPVDGGVFTVDSATGEARFTFKPKQAVAAVNAFAISRERKGGVPKAEGPILMLGK
jgi:anti-sigma-K factor RskA